MTNKILIVSAHVGDFVWRSAGSIAKYVQEGAQVDVMVLTYGARGESGSFYKQTGGTTDACRQVRRAEAEKAAQVLGVHSITFCGYDDFPLEMTEDRLKALATEIRKLHPDFILTHDDGMDRVNPDHTKTALAVKRAVSMAQSVDFVDGNTPLTRLTPMFGFEPLFPEACGYTPDLYIDITDVWDHKMAAMECLETQRNSLDAYVQKAILRASFCSGRGGRKDCKYAETFSMYLPICCENAFVW